MTKHRINFRPEVFDRKCQAIKKPAHNAKKCAENESDKGMV